ncbi:MAG: DUF2905 domain-containing protein [Nitrospirae bacterium]|nr:DUF2905 domain-containing protein [Nitrospirota bacterium]
MHDFNAFGKILVMLGIFMTALGAFIIAAGRIPGIGRLPGDIYIQRKNFTFYFPLASSLIISVILSLLFWFIFNKK